VSITIIAIDGLGAETPDYVSLLRASSKLLDVRSLKLLTSDPAARDDIVECVPISRLDYLAYSQFCIEELTNHVDTDHCLCVQLDGFILNPDRWEEAFLRFDFVGAPWSNKKNRPLAPGRSVGNGGFSLRSKRYLEASARCKWHDEWQDVDVPRKHWGNEDYFLNILHRDELTGAGVKFAPEEVAARFSIQSGDQLDRRHRLTTVFGFHGKGLLGRARRHTRGLGIEYPHLEKVRPSRFPWRY